MKRIIFPCLLVAMTLMSSCLTIYERYTLNRDGSGSFEYIIDMSELYLMMESFGGGSDSLDMGDADLSESFLEIIPELNAIPGISGAAVSGDDSKYIFGIKLDFKDEVALNKALAIIMNEKGSDGTRYVEISRKKFTRFHVTSDDFSKEALLGEEGEIDESMVQGMLEGMKYKIEVNVPGKVKSVQTKATVIRDEGKQVSIEADFNSMLDDNEYLKTVIKTK